LVLVECLYDTEEFRNDRHDLAFCSMFPSWRSQSRLMH
jgi:hypothetical protein